MNTEQTIMALVDAHVRASLEKFAGGKVDTTKTRTAIAQAVIELATEVAYRVAAPQPSVPSAKPAKSKLARIFGG